MKLNWIFISLIGVLISSLIFLTCGKDDDPGRLEVISRLNTSSLVFEEENIKRLLAYESYIIIQTSGNALIKYDINTEEASLIVNVSSSITDFCIDTEGTICIGTGYKGLYGYDLEGNELFHMDTLNSCMPTNYVSAIGVNDQQELYFGCLSAIQNLGTEFSYYGGYGLYRIDYNGENCTHWDTSSIDMTGNIISDLAIDEDQGVWMGINDKNYKNFPYRAFTWHPLHYLSAQGILDTFSIRAFDKRLVRDLKTVAGGRVLFNNFEDWQEAYGRNIQSLELTAARQMHEFGYQLNIVNKYFDVMSTGAIIECGQTPYYPDADNNQHFLYTIEGNVTNDYTTEIKAFFTETTPQSFVRDLVVTYDDRIWIATDTDVFELLFWE